MADTTEAITTEQFAERLSVSQETPESIEEAAAEETAAPEESAEEAVEAEAPEAEASEEESSADEAETPIIEPPSSFTEDEKAWFAELPPEAQETIQRRESDRDRAFNKRNQELAEERRNFDRQRQETEANLQQRMQETEAALTALQSLGDQAEPDWLALSQEDPAEYVRQKAAWDQRQDAISRAQAAQEQQRQDQLRQFQAQMDEKRESEMTALVSQWPEWADRGKAEKLAADVRDTLADYGYSAQEQESLMDHRALLVLRDAMAYRDLQKAKPRTVKQVREAPKMVKPGQPKTKGDRDAEEVKGLRAAVQSNPKDRDAIRGLISRHL